MKLNQRQVTIMRNSKSAKSDNADSETRADLDGEEYRDGEHYQPITTADYFKLLGYCTAGLVVFGVAIYLSFSFMY